MKTYNLTVDLKEKSYYKAPEMRYNDDNELVLEILDDGETANLSNITTASLAVTRLDRKVIVLNGTVEGNTATFNLTGDELAIAGRCDATAQFYDTDGRISTVDFSIVAVKDPTANGYDPSTEERTLIATVLSDGPLRIQEAINAGNYATEKGMYANTQGDYSKTQGEFAKSQGDYAKFQGDSLKGNIDNLDARINNLVGNTGNSNSEIVDGRVGADNVARANIGTLIREIHNNVKESNRQTQTLQHGTSVLNGVVGSPLDVEISGRTLVSLGNSTLSALKKYVLADKRTKVKWADGTIGTTKFVGKDERPAIIRIANFEGKIVGSTVENPHKVFGVSSGTSLSENTLQQPNSSNWYEFTELHGTMKYSRVQNLDGSVSYRGLTDVNRQDQQLFSFNLIEEVERKIGKIPKTTVADKVQWLKDNVAKLTCNWHGFGSGVGGNKASFRYWNANSSVWGSSGTYPGGGSSITSSISKLSWDNINGSITLNNVIDSNGFAHFLAYAEPSDGTTPSTINTDYVELEIELKPTATFTSPRVPLYEISDVEYNQIGVSLTDADVERMFPVVEGVQHLSKPYVAVEGENLLSQNEEDWEIGAFNASGVPTSSNTSLRPKDFIRVAPTSNYYASINSSYIYQLLYFYDVNKTFISSVNASSGNFTTPSNAHYIKFAFRRNDSANIVLTELSVAKPMLNLGSIAKPFVPRNPSYLYADVTLGQIGDKKDTLYKQDGKWLLRKAVEKDVLLDGNWNWGFQENKTGYKRFRHTTFLTYKTSYFFAINNSSIVLGIHEVNANITTQSNVIHFDSVGNMHISISNADTGFTDAMTPTADQIKAYFNGWKYAGDGTTHSWISIVDGTAPSTNTIDYVKANKAPNYTPYKLSYILATPQVIDVTDKVEGDLVVNGLTQVEVGSGVIVREKANPKLYSGDSYYYISNNLPDVIAGVLTYRTEKILNVYKNGIIDTSWEFGTSSRSNGKFWGRVHSSKFDPTAEYTVTYLTLDRHLLTNNATEVKTTFANNIRTALDETVKKQGDLATQVSITNRSLIDLYIRVKALEGGV